MNELTLDLEPVETEAFGPPPAGLPDGPAPTSLRWPTLPFPIPATGFPLLSFPKQPVPIFSPGEAFILSELSATDSLPLCCAPLPHLRQSCQVCIYVFIYSLL